MYKRIIILFIIAAAGIAGAFSIAGLNDGANAPAARATSSEETTTASARPAADASPHSRAPAIQQAASPLPATLSASASQPVEQQAARDTATLSAGGTQFGIAITEGMTVLDAMRAAAEQGFVFTGREYPSLGYFVESIGEKKSRNGMYWFLYVNDESSGTGASQTVVHSGDVIEWRYKSSF